MRKSAVPNVVHLRLLYDAFAPETVETHELKWRKSATLGDYLADLPDSCEWMIFANGREVTLADDAELRLERGDTLGLILIPQGGDGFKSIMRVLMQVAMIAVAFLVPVIGPLAAAAISIGLGLVSAFLLAPKGPKSQEESRSYGIDGAKNSATEGIPYPVVYGEFRTAGNFADCYTENVGDYQYLYIRSVMNDGLISGISAIEINEQPIDHFTDVQSRVSLGALNAATNDWFTQSIVQVNKAAKIDTNWVEHMTTSAVDRIRFDVAFTNGLVNIDSKKGTYSPRNVVFQMEARQVDPVTRQPIGNYVPVRSAVSNEMLLDMNGDGKVTIWETLGARISGVKPVAATNDNSLSAMSTTSGAAFKYRRVGDEPWIEVSSGYIRDNSYVFDNSGDGSVVGNSDVTPYGSFAVDLDLPAGDYEIEPLPGTILQKVEVYPSGTNFNVSVSDARTRQIRKTFTTERLTHGFYQARIRRATATSTDQYKLDEVYLTDVGEIQADPVNLAGTANLALRIKLSEQLNQIPTVTGLVRGSVVQKYDVEGNPTVKEWSANPAWIGLDMLCGIERGAGVALSRIDWPRWLEFAEYCEANNLTFNGVFDTGTNLGDALRSVLRVGHAMPTPFGTKFSVAVDRARKPVAAFTPANILKGTFELSYMPMADRANEYEFTYYDKTDRNKAKTIRYVDPRAITFNETPRVAQVSFPGIDNIDQARKELWRAIYSNRLLLRTLRFDAFLDAISLTLGDVALVQHDQMAWANAGRLKDGSTTTSLKLDQEVTLEAGVSYAALVHYDALKVADRTVSSVVGRKVMVTGASISSLTAKRLLIGSNDYEIVKIADGSTYHTITLATVPTGISAGQTVQLWDTDVIIERPVTNAGAAKTNTVQLSQALPEAPGGLANFVFGRVEKVRKPYALTSISGNGIEKRKLTFVEYHEAVYGPAEIEIPTPVGVLSDRDVDQVKGLLFDYEQITDPAKSVVNARVHWNAGSIRNYAGADVYMALNGGAPRALGSAAGLTEYHVQLSAGDVATFQVVAYNQRGDRARLATAPQVRGTIETIRLVVDPPGADAWAASAVLLSTNGTAVPAIEFSGSCDNPAATAIEFFYREQGSPTWISSGTTAVTSGIIKRQISAVRPQTAYYVAVAYQVNGTTGLLRQLTGSLTVGKATVPWDSVTNKDAFLAQISEIEADASGSVADIAALSNDGILTPNEKITKLITEDSKLEASWSLLDTQAASVSGYAAVTSARTVASNARTAWRTYRNALSPAWNNTALDTAVVRTTFNGKLNDFAYAVTALAEALRQYAVARGAQAGTNLYRSDNTTVMTQGEVRTPEGVSAGFNGQGALATISSLAYGSNLLTGFGSLAALAFATLGTNIRLSNGSTVATDGLLVTTLGTAAGFTGQGALATLSSLANGSNYLTGFGALSALAFTTLGTNVRRADGTTTLTDAMAVTALGTSAGFTGQGALATLSNVPATKLQLGDAENLILDPEFKDAGYWQYNAAVTFDLSSAERAALAANFGVRAPASTSGQQMFSVLPGQIKATANTTYLLSVRVLVPAGFAGSLSINAQFVNQVYGGLSALSLAGGNATVNFPSPTTADQVVTLTRYLRCSDPATYSITPLFTRVATTAASPPVFALPSLRPVQSISRLDLLDTSNMVPDPDFKDPSTWSGLLNAISAGSVQVLANTTTNEGSGVNKLRITSNAGATNAIDITSKMIPIEADTSLALSAYIKTVSGTTGSLRVQVLYYFAAGSGFYQQDFHANTTGTTGRAGAILKMPNNTAYFAIRIYGGASGDRVWELSEPQARIAARLAKNAVREDGTTPLTDAAAVTTLGTSAGFTGQSPWATYGTITPTNMAGRVQWLDSSTGNIDSLTRVVDRRITQVFRADGSTAVTEAAVVTNLGTASGFAGQGALATQSTVAYGSAYVTGFGSLAALAYTTLGSNVRLANGSTVATDGMLVTSVGVASAVTGQGALATQSTLAYGSGYLTGFGGLAALAYTTIGTNVRLNNGSTVATESMLVTSVGVASGFAGQGVLATQNSLAYGSSYLTGFGSLAASAYVTLSSTVRLADGTTIATNAMLVTSVGVAAGINGQGALATQSSVTWETQVVGGNKPENGADVTANNTHSMLDVAPIAVSASPAGVVDAGQLPVTRSVRRMKGQVDVSPSTTYSIQMPSTIVATINNDAGSDSRGDVTVTAILGASGAIQVTAVYEGVATYKTIAVSRNDAAPTVSTGGSGGGSGAPGTPASTSAITNPGYAGYHQDLTPSLAVVVGSSGQVNLAATLTYFSTAGSEMNEASINGKFVYSANGSTGWSDVGGESAGSSASNWFSVQPPKGRHDSPGALMFGQSKTGLTPGSTAYFRLAGRVESVGDVGIASVSGTVTATPV